MKPIEMDLARTTSLLTEEPLTEEERQELGRVLTVLSYLHPSIGYSSGMNFFVNALYSYLNDEEYTFSFAHSLIEHKKLKGMFAPSRPEYFVKSFILESLIKNHLPNVHSALKKANDLPITTFSSQWLIVVFTNTLKYDQLMPFLDNFFMKGWIAVFQMCLAILQTFEPIFLMAKDSDQLMGEFVNMNAKIQSIDSRGLMQLSSQFAVTEEEVRLSELAYFNQEVKNALTGGSVHDPQLQQPNQQL